MSKLLKRRAQIFGWVYSSGGCHSQDGVKQIFPEYDDVAADLASLVGAGLLRAHDGGCYAVTDAADQILRRGIRRLIRLVVSAAMLRDARHEPGPAEKRIDALIAGLGGPLPEDTEPPSVGTMATIFADEPAEQRPSYKPAICIGDPRAIDIVLDDLRVHAPGKPGSTARQISLRTAMPLKDVQRALRALGTHIDAAGKTRGRRYWVREGDSA